MLGMVIIGIAALTPPQDGSVTLRTRYLEWVLNPQGRTVRFTDRAAGKDYALRPGELSFITAKVGQIYVPCAHLKLEKDMLAVQFETGPSEKPLAASLRVHTVRDILVFDVLSVTEGVEEIRFGVTDLTLKGDLSEPFAACSLARNVRTNVPTLPGPCSGVGAIAYARLGMVGASAAVVAGPTRSFRKLLQQAVAASPALPHSPIGGPWALDSPSNRKSYLFNFGNLNVATSPQWITLAHALGAGQIDFHGGVSFRFGDFAPDPKTYPNGIADLKATVDALHAAGIQAGLHTYAFFIAKNSKYVTPVPDHRLAALRTFTLAEPLDASSTTINVAEPTVGVNAITGFFVNNSASLRIGDEMVTFTEASQTPPWRFTGCTRGAYGTRAAPHAAGERADHLKELFGLFAPDAESDLFGEIVENTARTYNECGFDMIYLDALDGSYIHAGPEWAWYYGAQFTYDLVRRLKKPAILEMSTFHHHLWCVRARMGAWDAPHTGFKDFVDMHRVVNRDCERMYLPSILGWWGVFTWDGIQPDRTFPDDLEYLMCKALADNAGVAFVAGFAADTFPNDPGAQRYAQLIRRYEELRQSGAVPANLRRRLGVPGDEYTLADGPRGERAFVPVRYVKAIAEGSESAHSVANAFEPQPLSVRIEALLSVASGHPASEPLLSAGDASALSQPRCADGVQMSVRSEASPPGDGTGPRNPAGQCLHLSVSSKRALRLGSWAMVERVLPSPVDMTHKGLGVWIYGDGKGAVLNFQLRNAEHIGVGVAEHYVVVDFTGWRYIELVEPESDRLSSYSWPYSAHRSEWSKNPGLAAMSAYKTYHPWFNYQNVGSVAVWVNEVPPGGTTDLLIGDVVPLPLTGCKVREPSVTMSGRTLTFPVDLESGQYLEMDASGVVTVYGPENQILRTVKPEGQRPQLGSVVSELRFRCGADDSPAPRARLTVIERGTPIRF